MDSCCGNCGWSEIVGSTTMCNYSGHGTRRDECCKAWKPKEEAENMVQVVLCKDCKHFEIKDYWMDYGGVPILAASDCPTCNKWADGCKTKPDGYCFMAERRD